MKKALFLTAALVSLVLLLASCSHKHTYQDWEIIKEPTCTEKGEREGTCSCGEKSTLFVSSLEHDLNENYICNVCSQQVFNLTSSEKRSCSKVFMYSNVQVSYVVDEKTEKEHFEFRFSLNDESEAMLAAPTFVDVKIYDYNNENLLYSKTFAVKSVDYISYFYENNTLKKLLATVIIPKEDILPSAHDYGFLSFRLYNSDYFDTDAGVMNTGEEPVLPIEKGLPECEHTFSETTGICSKCDRECEHIFVDDACEICLIPDPDKITIIFANSAKEVITVNEESPFEITFFDKISGEGKISIEILSAYKNSKTSFGLYIKAKITEFKNGSTDNCRATIGYKLYDEEDGVISQSGILVNEISEVGEYFIMRGTLSSLTPGKTYKLVLLERGEN